MCESMIFRFLASIFAILLFGCGGPDEGIYSGKIGDKKKVEIRVNQDGEVVLDGYWKEALEVTHEPGTYKGEDMGALVFEGPASKKFKLRILYQEQGNELIIRAIQSRTYGPGARYISTEEKSAFTPPPRLRRLSVD